MFSFLARSRALAVPLFLFPAFAYSREEALFASSVTYCEQPQTLLVQQFDLAFFPANQSVSFNISAASVTPDVNVTANLLLNVYGMNPVNFTLDLCSVLGGALCPLPTYNFIGADSIRLPQSLGVDGRIPAIAFKIPDLEGFAQLTLTEIGTGEVKACIQATLSNGWSTHQPVVEYVTAGLALAAFLSALAHSVFPESLAPFRFLDMFYLYQAIASSAFLNINYPSLYRAFTLNFAWAVGLVRSRTSSLQPSIDHMRHLTGGSMTNSTSSSAVGFVNRKLSPWNTDSSVSGGGLGIGISLRRRGVSALGDMLQAFSESKLQVTDAGEPAIPVNPNLRMNLAIQPAVVGEVQVVTPGSANVLNAGIPIYTNSIHIGTANAFMTVFIVALIVLVIVGALLACGYGVAVAIRRLRTKKGKETHFDFLAFVKAWLVRLALLFLFPLLIFAFYQWTLKDSWLSILLSVIAFIGLLAFLIYPPYLIFSSLRESKNPFELYSHTPPTYLFSLGPLYAQFRPERYYVFLTLLVAPFVKAIFISFAKPSGLAQVILLFVTEFIVLGCQIAFKSHKTRGGDVLSTYLGVTRVVATGLLIAFVERVAVNAIPRTVIGAVIGVIWSVAVVILILDLIIYHILVPLWQLATGRFRSGDSTVTGTTSSPLNSEGSMLEKGEKRFDDQHLHPHRDVLPSETGITPAPSWDRVTAGRRALNPTPDQNIPLDPHILQTYPVSPTESVTTGHGSEIPSMYSRDSGTITVGSLLPRRWSFSTGIGSFGGGGDSLPASPAAYSQPSSRPQSATQSQHSQSYYSQPSSPATPAERSEESGGVRLQAIQEQPSQSSGLDVPRSQNPQVMVTSPTVQTVKSP